MQGQSARSFLFVGHLQRHERHVLVYQAQRIATATLFRDIACLPFGCTRSARACGSTPTGGNTMSRTKEEWRLDYAKNGTRFAHEIAT